MFVLQIIVRRLPILLRSDRFRDWFIMRLLRKCGSGAVVGFHMWWAKTPDGIVQRAREAIRKLEDGTTHPDFFIGHIEKALQQGFSHRRVGVTSERLQEFRNGESGRILARSLGVEKLVRGLPQEGDRVVALEEVKLISGDVFKRGTKGTVVRAYCEEFDVLFEGAETHAMLGERDISVFT